MTMNYPSYSTVGLMVLLSFCCMSGGYILHKKNIELDLLTKRLKKEEELKEEERRSRIALQQKNSQIVREISDKDGYSLVPIGYVESPFVDRRGTPRQPTLVTAAKGRIRFNKSIIQFEHFSELELFSHLWVIFIFNFNTNIEKSVHSPAKIKPPRLNGSKVGCLSTRSPHRPNPIGLSVVEIVEVGKDYIDIKSIDLVDGTVVVDIKPYIPYDNIPCDLPLPMAIGEDGKPLIQTTLKVPQWIYESEIELFPVRFNELAMNNLKIFIENKELKFYSDEKEIIDLITQVLRQDIRSVNQGRGVTNHEPYSCRLDQLHIDFINENNKIIVKNINLYK